jgi:alkanesulfonate monooxygenase SsuD/methylene tetrahydromethanopterin reductase-like flavin-dependent oxidoreductase (luciferase family)
VDRRRGGDQPDAPDASTLSTFYYEPPQPWVHADLRPVQAGGPPIWIGGASEAAMRRVGRSGVGWLGFDGLPPPRRSTVGTRAPTACGRSRAERRRTPAAIPTR